MKTLLLLFATTSLLSQSKLDPIVTFKDKTEKAYRTWTNHPNGWDGGHEEFVGIDTVRIFKTYVVIEKDSFLLSTKRIYLTTPKGGSEGYTGPLHKLEKLYP